MTNTIFSSLIFLQFFFLISCSDINTANNEEEVFNDMDTSVLDNDIKLQDSDSGDIDWYDADQWDGESLNDQDFDLYDADPVVDDDIVDDDIEVNKSDVIKEWTKQWGSSSGDHADSVTINSEGDVFLTGATYCTIDWNSDVIIFKVRDDGDLKWERQFGSEFDDHGYDITVDKNDNVFVAGVTLGSIDGNPNKGYEDSFLVKLNPDGTRSWARQWGSAFSDRAFSVATDMDGNIYVAGDSDGVIEGGVNESGEYWDIFLSKFDNDGNIKWIRQWGSGKYDGAKSIVIDHENKKIFMTGSTDGKLDGGEKSGEYDLFLTKLDMDGNREWTRQWGSSEIDFGISVAVSGSGNIFISGNTEGAIGENVEVLPEDQMFLTRFSPDGEYEWTKQWGKGYNSYLTDMEIDAGDKIFVTGSVGGEFEGFVNEKYMDVFITKWDEDGNIEWNEQWGTDYANAGLGIAVNDEGSIYVTGRTEGPLAENAVNDWEDIFLTKFVLIGSLPDNF
ncbi:MAG TPA: SBBP repeat-containing protein [bacterium]|nr:SBBP repeat-containing protein [bacterium]